MMIPTEIFTNTSEFLRSVSIKSSGSIRGWRELLQTLLRVASILVECWVALGPRREEVLHPYQRDDVATLTSHSSVGTL